MNTPLDLIDNPHSPRHGMHFGSVMARDLVEQFEPVLCAGGHMHEHFGICRIKSSTVLNAGFGKDVNTFVELGDGTINKIVFHGGNSTVYP